MDPAASDLAQIEDCIARYPAIGPVHSCESLPAGRFHNALFEVRAASGRYILKILTTHSEESTEARYDYIASAMGEISTLGVRCPFPVKNGSGLNLTPCGGHPAVLSEYIEGTDFRRDSLNHQRGAGDLLGRIHSATASFVPRKTCWIGGIDSFFVRDDALSAKLPDTHDGASVQDRFDGIVDWCLEVSRELEDRRYGTLPRGVVHSEYVVKHLKMAGDQVAGLLDFEYTFRDARAIDVALALEDFPCSSRGARDFSDERIRAFLSAYNAAGAPLLPEEIAALPVLLKAWCLDSLGYWVHRLARTGEHPGLFDMAERTSQDLRYLDWWDANGSAFADRVARLSH